jgi:hypothetical protein
LQALHEEGCCSGSSILCHRRRGGQIHCLHEKGKFFRNVRVIAEKNRKINMKKPSADQSGTEKPANLKIPTNLAKLGMVNVRDVIRWYLPNEK